MARRGNQEWKLDTREKEQQALELRLAGYDFDTIAKQLGYANRSSAWKACQRSIERIPVAAATELRTVELERLDRLQRNIWFEATTQKNLSAIDRLLRIMERRARLMGLDLKPAVDVSDEGSRYDNPEIPIPSVDPRYPDPDRHPDLSGDDPGADAG